MLYSNHNIKPNIATKPTVMANKFIQEWLHIKKEMVVLLLPLARIRFTIFEKNNNIYSDIFY